MKKLLYIVLFLLSIVGHVFSFYIINNKLIDDFIFLKTKVSLDYKSDIKIDSQEFIEHILKFSNENNVNIAQYNFVGEDKLNIYDTNIKYDEKIKLEKGNLPSKQLYISNEEMNIKKENQNGKFYFPFSKFKINIYTYEQVENVGIGNEFYFTNQNENILKKFKKEFSYYADISIEKPKLYWHTWINNIFFSMGLFLLLILFILFISYFIQYRKEMILKKIWGYSDFRISCSLLNEVLILWGISSIFMLVILASILLIFNKIWLINVLLRSFIANTIILGCIVLLFCFIANKIVRVINEEFENIKNKKSLLKLQIGVVVIKGISCLLLFFILSNVFIEYINLETKTKNLKNWKEVQNTYKIGVGSLFDETLNDLKKDREYNEKALKFYTELKKRFNGFIMESDNFRYIDSKTGNLKYFYEIDTYGEEQIYSPQGRKVLVDCNYFKKNPIEEINGKILTEKTIDWDKNTLNLLVPEQYKKYENKIDFLYKKWFYFYKVKVENIYNRELGKKINSQSIRNLKINIIYTKKGQLYSTFNPDTGDINSKIKDPIAIIFNEESIDSSYIGALMTRGVYFQDYSRGESYNNIKPLINKIRIQEIDRVESVYSEANNKIIKLKELLVREVIVLGIVLTLSLVLFFVLVWIHYFLNMYELNIKYIFGYSCWEKNKYIIIPIIVIYLLAIFLLIVQYKNIIYITIPSLFFISAFELIFINQIIDLFRRRDINKLLKGDLL